jgi:hypothetical protein
MTMTLELRSKIPVTAITTSLLCHNQVEHRLVGKPRRPRAVLVQHHALAGLALALAAMCPARRLARATNGRE